jgi:hypothetical protein
MKCSAPLFLALIFSSACAAQPPAFVGRIEPISAPLVAKMRSSTWHAGCPVSPDDLRQLTLSYWNFAQVPTTGVLVVDKGVAEEVVGIFRELFRHRFLIEKMSPVEDYQGSDDASMAANNTSAFNCRDITGQPGKFSNHSWGRAIDINPLTNPYIKGDKVLPPEGKQYLDRTKAFPGSILADSFVVKQFTGKGWAWGGSWSDRKDYQHFEKPAAH